MLSLKDLKATLENGGYDFKLSMVYGCEVDEVAVYKERFMRLIGLFEEKFGKAEEAALFSAPGRTEIGGNHTDHQHGHVLAASVNLDTIAVAALNGSDEIHIQSEGYPMDTIKLSELDPDKKEYGKASALIRGVISRFEQMGYTVKGFDAYTTTNVLKGSGLSSSAAFEVLIGNIANTFFAGGAVSNIEIAKISQYAENVFFGKPCGLMDQMASSVGSIVAIDFLSTKEPVVEKVEYDFSHSGYSLCIIDSGADHADLTEDYAAIPVEMSSIAQYWGEDYLRDIPEEQFYDNIPALRKSCGDRAILRAMHFYEDDKRVAREVAALKENNFKAFRKEIIQSGRSSFMYLQNVYTNRFPQAQAVSILLALCEKMLKGKGAWRVHGGGFAGTLQAFVPNDMVDNFKKEIEKVAGEGACHILNIRPTGGTRI